MPRIKRWFHKSHDTNRDPEMWEFRELIGPRADAIWDEILSIADRNEGELPGLWESYPRLLAGACHSTPSRVRVALDWLTTPRGRRLQPWVALDSDQSARVTNWLIYNPSRDANKIPRGIGLVSPPNLPILPILKEKKKIGEEEKKELQFSVTELISLYNAATPTECPAIETLTPARKDKAKKYLAIFPKKEFWEEVFSEIHRSRFLRGLNKQNGHEHFVASLDWLLTKGKDGTENVIKVQEGKYRDGRQ